MTIVMREQVYSPLCLLEQSLMGSPSGFQSLMENNSAIACLLYCSCGLLCDLEPKCMLKVVDWPPSEPFSERLKRHHQDFMEMLPLPEYMHPTLGPLNTHRYDSHIPRFRITQTIANNW